MLAMANLKRCNPRKLEAGAAIMASRVLVSRANVDHEWSLLCLYEEDHDKMKIVDYKPSYSAGAAVDL